jgi:hypothetical protein
MSDYGMENVTLTSMNRNPAEDVRYRRNSGKHLLVLSFSHFDPKATLGKSAIEPVGCNFLSVGPLGRGT